MDIISYFHIHMFLTYNKTHFQEVKAIYEFQNPTWNSLDFPLPLCSAVTFRL